MSRFNVWPWVRPFLILVLIIAVPPLVYWFGYVQNHVASARREAYATLSAVTADFRSRLIAHNQIAANAERRSMQEQEAQLTEFLNALLKDPAISEVELDAAQPPHLRVGGSYGGLQLRMGQIRDSQICSSGRPCTVQAVIPLEHLIAWNVVETEFDGLLVLSARKKLLWAQDRRLPAQPVGSAVPIVLKSSEIKKAAAQDDKLLNHLFDFPNEGSLQLAGVEYVAFIQSVRVPVTSIASVAKTKGGGLAPVTPKMSSVTVLVCGLIAKDKLRRESIQLSPQTLLGAGSLLALGVFAIPFLKLRFISACERMRRRDIWWLAAALLSTTVLMLLLILNAHARYKLSMRFDGGLERLTASLIDHLLREKNAAVAQLYLSAPDLLKDLKSKEKCDRQPANDPAPSGAILAERTFTAYPDMEAILVTDICGNQLRKWMPRTVPTAKINHQSESFFAPALSLPYVQPPQPLEDFAFGATLAPTSGLHLGVFAAPIGASTQPIGAGVAPADRKGVAVIATTMRSLNAPVIAQPYQFVIVDRSDVVVFQKTRGSYQGERFFDAVQGGEMLKFAARNADRTPHTYRYRDKSYRMLAADIPGLKLTLVAYYETAVIGAVAARIFTVAAVCALGIVLAILLGAAFSFATLGGGALDWAWPSPSRYVQWLVGLAVCALWMGVLLVARLALPSSWVPWILFVAPPLLLFVISLVYRHCVKKARLERCAQDGACVCGTCAARGDLKIMAWKFIGLFVMVLLTFISLPTWLAYNDAFDLHATTFGSEVTKKWLAERQRLQDVNRATFVEVDRPLKPVNCNARPDLRCSTAERIYITHENHSRLLALRGDLPVYYDCARLIDQNPHCDVSAPPATPYSFTVTVARLLSKFGQVSPEYSRILLAIANGQPGIDDPPLLHGMWRSFWTIGAFCVLVVLMWLLVRSIANHVLGIKVTDGDLLDESQDVQQSDGKTWLLLRPSRESVERLRRPIEKLDLRNRDQPNEFAPPKAGCTLLIEHLEARLSDKAARKAVFELLSASRAGCLVMTSEIDPFHFLTRRLREVADDLAAVPNDEKNRPRYEKAAQECEELRNELLAWATALRDSRKIRERVPLFPRFEKNAPDAQRRAQIAEECAATEALVEIGKRLLQVSFLEKYRWEDTVGFVLDAAEPYYRAIWEQCSREERLVLIQLAQEGLINPKRSEIVQRLARRRLVLVDPRFRLMNRSFQRFVCSVEPPERVVQWERTGGSMSWARLGTPLYALAAVVVVVLLFAEQALFTDILAIATGGAAALGSLRSLFVSMKGGTVKEVQPA